MLSADSKALEPTPPTSPQNLALSAPWKCLASTPASARCAPVILCPCGPYELGLRRASGQRKESGALERWVREPPGTSSLLALAELVSWSSCLAFLISDRVPEAPPGRKSKAFHRLNAPPAAS